MPVLIPIIVAAAAYAGSAIAVGAMVTAGMVAAGSIAAVVAGVVVGAVIGAAVGAVGAAVTGGDIGKGALWGAVGGAVAGGFAGYGAGAASDGGAGSSINNSSLDTMNGMGAEAGANTASAGGGAATGSEAAGMTSGEGAMWGQGISTAGEMIVGYAGGEAEAESNADAIAANEKSRQEEFEQRMKEINANHQNSLASIQAQSDNSLALADKNNAAAKDQLNTRIGADRDVVTAANAKEDSKIAGFNESVRGTDETLFSRPTFKFDPESDVAFDSGFDERAGNSQNLSPEEIAAINEQREVTA